MAKRIQIAQLVASLGLNSATFDKNLKRSKQNLSGWANDAKRYGKAGAVALAGSAAVAAAGLTMLTREAMANVDAMAKHADKIGMTTQALAGLRHQAELNGVSTNALDIGLQRMVRRVAEAAQGTGEAKAALEELNLSAQEMAALSPDQQFAKIADAMGNVSSQSDKVRLGFKLFDSEGVGLINAMRGGSEELAKAAAEAEALGIAVNRVDAAKIEAANDASHRADMAMKGLGNSIAIEVAPIITSIKTGFVDAALEAGGFKSSVANAIDIAAKGVGVLANSIRGMQLIWKGAQLAVASFAAAAIMSFNQVVKGYSELANLIPGIEINHEDTWIGKLTSEAKLAIEKIKGEMHDLATQGLPSEAIEKWLKDVRQKSEENAKEVANDAAKSTATSESLPTGFAASDFSKAESELAENEHFIEAYERRQKIIDDALQAKQISEEQHFAVSTKNWAKYQAAIKEMESERAQVMLSSTQSFFANMATLSDHGNKNLRRIGAASAAINIVIGTLESAQNAYKVASSWGGPIAGAAAATAATVAGMMRLRQLQQTAGGGGGASISSGGLSGQTTYDQELPTASSMSDTTIATDTVNSEASAAAKAAGSKGQVINLMEDASKAGRVERGLTEEDVVNIYVSNIQRQGEIAKANESTYNLARYGS